MHPLKAYLANIDDLSILRQTGEPGFIMLNYWVITLLDLNGTALIIDDDRLSVIDQAGQLLKQEIYDPYPLACMKQAMDKILGFDPTIAQWLRREEQAQRTGYRLIPSEQSK
ncbi:hypothetical protein ACP8Y2_23220 [Herpetosiphon llansteffanensis]